MRWQAAGAIGIAALLTARAALPAFDPGEPIALAWASLPGCPGEPEVRAEIERVLGSPPDPASRRYLRAEARVSRAGAGFHVHIVTDLGGVTGERDIDGPTCAAVGNAAALIVALTFDPEALSRRAEACRAARARARARPRAAAAPSAALEPSILPPPLPDAAVPPETRAWSPPAAPPHSAGRAEARSAPSSPWAPSGRPRSAPCRGWAAASEGRAGILVGRLRVDVSASYWPEQTATLASRPTAGGRVRLVAGDGSACWALLRAPVEILPCLGLEVGSMSATGFGVRSDSSGSALWIAPVAEAVAALPLGKRFAARLDLGVLVPAERPSFLLNGAGTVYTAGTVAGRAALGLEVRF